MGKISKKEIQEIAQKEIDEMYASWLKDVEYIEIFWIRGGTDKFTRDDIIRYCRTDTTFEIKAKSGDLIVNTSETIKIIIKKKEKKKITYKKCPKPTCDGKLIYRHNVLDHPENENDIYRCNKCGYALTLESYKLIPNEENKIN